MFSPLNQHNELVVARVMKLKISIKYSWIMVLEWFSLRREKSSCVLYRMLEIKHDQELFEFSKRDLSGQRPIETNDSEHFGWNFMHFWWMRVRAFLVDFWEMHFMANRIERQVLNSTDSVKLQELDQYCFRALSVSFFRPGTSYINS